MPVAGITCQLYNLPHTHCLLSQADRQAQASCSKFSRLLLVYELGNHHHIIVALRLGVS